jgi:predicted RNA binding protein YcfA (HicA-like mRNA interferase family)
LVGSTSSFSGFELGTPDMNVTKLFAKAARSPASCRFTEIQRLLGAFGFHLSRVTGSHHIYTHPGIPELVNLQSVKGMAKAYQVRQLLRLVERYNLELEPDE